MTMEHNVPRQSSRAGAAGCHGSELYRAAQRELLASIKASPATSFDAEDERAWAAHATGAEDAHARASLSHLSVIALRPEARMLRKFAPRAASHRPPGCS
jgi:hypothetical protein